MSSKGIADLVNERHDNMRQTINELAAKGLWLVAAPHQAV